MIELNGVRGFLTPGDVAFLFNLATELSAGGRYLEIGSWLGLSSIVVANGLIANLNFHAQVYCVDAWRGLPEHPGLPEVQHDQLYDGFLRNISEAQVDTFVRPVRGASIEVARQWSGPRLDTIFIDGDHSLEGCYRDFCAWREHLTPGGRLLGHDAASGSEVEQAVQRYCLEHDYTARIHPLPVAHYVWENQLAPTASA